MNNTEYRCPRCGKELTEIDGIYRCSACGADWTLKDGALESVLLQSKQTENTAVQTKQQKETTQADKPNDNPGKTVKTVAKIVLVAEILAAIIVFIVNSNLWFVSAAIIVGALIVYILLHTLSAALLKTCRI